MLFAISRKAMRHASQLSIFRQDADFAPATASREHQSDMLWSEFSL